MTDKEAYQHLQASWVKDNNIKVGDIVKVLRIPKRNELGSDCWSACYYQTAVGTEISVDFVYPDKIVLDGYGWPFFCLEFVRKAPPKIKITCEVNGKKVPLKDLSEETLLKLRRRSECLDF